MSNSTPDSAKPKTERYSFFNLFRDAAIVLLATLPESAQRISLLYTDKPLIPMLEEMGVSVNWLLFITVPLGLMLFFKTHRTKAKEEAIFLADKFPKNAPVLLFVLVCAFSLLIFHGCNVSSENSRLRGELVLATNPPLTLQGTNSSQIVLSSVDFSALVQDATEFCKTFTKTNGQPPKIRLILYPSSINSRILFRQFKDAFQQAGWDFELNKYTLQNPIDHEIRVYVNDPSKPSSQFNFWNKELKKCALFFSPGVWIKTGTALDIGDEDVVLIINDPDYFQ